MRDRDLRFSSVSGPNVAATRNPLWYMHAQPSSAWKTPTFLAPVPLGNRRKQCFVASFHPFRCPLITALRFLGTRSELRVLRVSDAKMGGKVRVQRLWSRACRAGSFPAVEASLPAIASTNEGKVSVARSFKFGQHGPERRKIESHLCRCQQQRVTQVSVR